MSVITSGARRIVATVATSALILAGAAVAAAPAGASGPGATGHHWRCRLLTLPACWGRSEESR